MRDTDAIPIAQLRTMQIIAGAMIWGVVFALGIFLFLVLAQQHKPILVELDELHIVSLLAILAFITNAPLAFIVPGIQTKNSLRQIAAARRVGRTPGEPMQYRQFY